MLYCKACNYVADAGRNSCANCGNGYVSQLICGACGKDVQRGASSCERCQSHGVSAGLVPRYPPTAPPGVSITIIPFGGEQSVPPVMGALAIPGLPTDLMRPVHDSYSHGRFGVSADVQLNGRDADILTKMKQTAALLHVLAQEMNNLQGHMTSTRAVIKSCRNLAAEIQEEVEVRLGPQGR